ncbi:ypdP [Symbiodinium necroappetens]|uniref:YpdP protein n=1 Tax=Symbiodinium necroappetens TaxID=1628268 RepID=A0A812MGR9_9DINO|nr:ypdP [Symbiodinium necroappetens]
MVAVAHRRREGLFLVFAGLFLGSLTMLNILGVTRFIRLGEAELFGRELVFAIAVGVLPYPITFLCTDFISELYGRGRANLVVVVGFGLNLWVMLILWLGGALPGFEARDDAGALVLDAAGRAPIFFEVRTFAFAAVGASMVAYLVAQLVDVQMFHLWKRVTKGKHLWLRNNGSTVVSQLVDTVLVIFITYRVGGLTGVIDEDAALAGQLFVLILTGYAFKLLCALLDTGPFYVGAHYLTRYLRLPPPTHDPHPPAAAAVEAGVG